MKAKSKGIELYRILPNATHLMQPLDKGVFGPLKSKWHLTTRKYTRENPGKAIGKENFAVKLSETFLHFYKQLTVINAFKSAGIYPVDSTVITHEMLKPSLTYTDKAANLMNVQRLRMRQVLVVKKNLRNKRKPKVHLRFFRALFPHLSGSAMPIN